MLTDPVVSGASVRIGERYELTSKTHLVDTCPFTTSFLDSALLAGRGVYDPVGGIHVETLSADPSELEVAVKFGYTDSPPTASAGAGHEFAFFNPSPIWAPLLRLIEHVHHGAWAIDGDQNLMSYEWSFSSCPRSCPTLQGSTAEVSEGNVSIPGPNYTANYPGTYRLTLRVWDTSGRSSSSTAEERALLNLVFS